jgi:hypothetical protein
MNASSLAIWVVVLPLLSREDDGDSVQGHSGWREHGWEALVKVGKSLGVEERGGDREHISNAQGGVYEDLYEACLDKDTIGVGPWELRR